MFGRLPLAAALFVLSQTAVAQLYSWEEGGERRISAAAPVWYRLDEPVKGPRVRVTQGARLIDDTGLPLERRLELRRPPQSPTTGRRAPR